MFFFLYFHSIFYFLSFTRVAEDFYWNAFYFFAPMIQCFLFIDCSTNSHPSSTSYKIYYLIIAYVSFILSPISSTNSFCFCFCYYFLLFLVLILILTLVLVSKKCRGISFSKDGSSLFLYSAVKIASRSLVRFRREWKQD